MIQVSAIETVGSLIERRVLSGASPILIESSDPGDFQWFPQLAHLPRETEGPALRRNALYALDQVEAFAHPPGRLLDFGCGWGFFLETAQQRGWEPHGLNPQVGPAYYGRIRFKLPVVADVLKDDTYPPGHFDLVTAFQVFEHLVNPSEALARLHTVLRPGGIMLIEVPNIDTWSFRVAGRWHRHFVHEHANFFSAGTLATLLTSHGFQVVRTYYPWRRMTVAHLAEDWGGRLLPKAFVRAISKSLGALKLSERVISLNLGDIVAVVARKSGEAMRPGVSERIEGVR